MKKILAFALILPFIMSVLSGCSDTIGNKITLTNSAAYKVSLNFRASLITVEPGTSVDITDIPKGKYSYDTIFDVPPDPDITSEAYGAVTGELSLAAGTKILIFYSSTLVQNVYKLTATMSSSDGQTTGDPVGP